MKEILTALMIWLGANTNLSTNYDIPQVIFLPIAQMEKMFYEDQEFSKKIYAEIEKESSQEFKKLTEKKNELIKELDSLLIETYQTSSVLIDDAKLVSGEEGCLCTLDIEFIKNNNREGLFDPRKMSNTVKDNILKKLEQLQEQINLK